MLAATAAPRHADAVPVALGVVVLFAATGGPALLLEILVASFLGVVTLAWRVVALLWRASRRWPGRVPGPGPLTVDPD